MRAFQLIPWYQLSSWAISSSSVANTIYAGGGNGLFRVVDVAPLGTKIPPSLTIETSGTCIGSSWIVRVAGAVPNAKIRLVGTHNGVPFEGEDWGQTDFNGSFTSTGSFPEGTEGSWTLQVFVDGLPSNTVSFSVTNCFLSLSLNATEFCTGDSWQLRVTSNFPNASLRLSGTSRGAAWEIPDWKRTDANGSLDEVGIFAAGNEGAHALQVKIGDRLSNVVSLTISRCSP